MKSIKTGKKKLESSPFWNPDPLSWNPESSTRNPESTGWNPESKTVMDSLTWGEKKMSTLDILTDGRPLYGLRIQWAPL